MDGTLIKTKSGNKFPKSSDDWCWLTPLVPIKIASLVENGYGIVICTNQSQFNSEIGTKIETVCKKLAHFIIVLVSTGYTKYRKPMIGMWDYLNGLLPNVDKSASFYVGDAVDKNLDHSNCDLLWAYNVGIPFHYSYHYFNSPDPTKTDRVVPVPIKPDFNQSKSVEPRATVKQIISYDLVLLVGPPAIGKSQFATRLSEEYNYKTISQDHFKTNALYKKNLVALLKTNSPLVIDNNHYTAKSRQDFLELVKEHRPASLDKCVVVLIHPTENQREIAEYLNYHRCYLTNKWIHAVVYNTYYKNYEKPTNSEGFSAILEYYIDYDPIDKFY